MFFGIRQNKTEAGCRRKIQIRFTQLIFPNEYLNQERGANNADQGGTQGVNRNRPARGVAFLFLHLR